MIKMSVKHQLDDIDLKILDVISKNARMPFKDVASECGISRAAVHQRVNRMIDMGVIVGSGYHIDPKMVDFHTCTFIGIFLERGSLYEEAAKELRAIPEVVECHYTTGKYAIFAKVYARTNEHLKSILCNRIQKISGVSSTETLISLEETFKREVPIYEEEEVFGE